MMRAVGLEVRHTLYGVDGSDAVCCAAEHAAWLAHTFHEREIVNIDQLEPTQ